jgi:hypothetical protein
MPAAIDPLFQTSVIQNEASERDDPYFWSSTTHEDGPNAGQATYIAFGRAIGQMRGRIMDVHAAGAQRSDPKEGEARLGHGPQGDAQRVLNYVRVVRGGAIQASQIGSVMDLDSDAYPQTIRVGERRYQPAASEYRNPPDRQRGGESDQQRRPPPPRW